MPPCPHFDLRIVQRSKRQSAVASAAYQSGERLFSEYDQKQKYYDIAPFKNILNEMYSKDISKKVHSSYLLKTQKRQFTGCLAPFENQKKGSLLFLCPETGRKEVTSYHATMPAL